MSRRLSLRQFLAIIVIGFYSSTASAGTYNVLNVYDTAGVGTSAVVLNGAMNGQGDAAAVVQFGGGNDAIISIPRGGAPTTVVDTSGPFRLFNGAPAVANTGSLAFHGFLDAGGDGLFSGPDPVALRIVSTPQFNFVNPP